MKIQGDFICFGLIFCAITSAYKFNSNFKEALAALWTCILIKHAKVKVGTLNPTSCNAEKPWPTPRTYGLSLDMRQNLAYIPSLFLMPGSMSMSRLAAFKSNVC